MPEKSQINDYTDTYTVAVMNEDGQGKGSPGKPPFGVHESANMAFNGAPIRRHRADEKHSQVW